MERILKSRITSVVVIILFLLALIKLASAYRGWRDLHEKESQLLEKTITIEAENKELREEIRISGTPEAIERDGKARLNMKLPGERVVIVVDQNGASATSSTAPSVWRRVWQAFTSFFSR